MIGTSNRNIGKPLSPSNCNRENIGSNAATAHQKAIWVSKLHRDTTEEDLEAYIKDLVGGVSTDQYDVRKLHIRSFNSKSLLQRVCSALFLIQANGPDILPNSRI